MKEPITGFDVQAAELGTGRRYPFVWVMRGHKGSGSKEMRKYRRISTASFLRVQRAQYKFLLKG